MNLTDGLTEHLQDVVPPHPDLDRVLDRGRRVRRRRRAVGVSVVALGLVATGAVGTSLLRSSPGAGDITVPSIASGGPMDLSQGLRAYGDPGGEIRMGGRSFPSEDLPFLDTDAAATSYGIVFFRDGRPYLLRKDGTAKALWQDPVEDPKGWHPTAKFDPTTEEVAFAVHDGEKVTVVVQELGGDAERRLVLGCSDEPGCKGLVVDGIDSGTVFVRTEEGTFSWVYSARDEQGLEPFAGPTTRVADAKNKTLLYDGPRPLVTLPGWTYYAGPVDAQLSHDGWNVLSWSPVLKSVANGEAITLLVPKDAVFFTFDTDGSVLAATTGQPARFFDCELPSGACEEIGRLRMRGGDPMFIGNDM